MLRVGSREPVSRTSQSQVTSAHRGQRPSASAKTGRDPRH